MDTAFIIGNGESRNIFPIKDLKDKHYTKALENEAIFKAAKIKDNVIPAIEDQLKSALKLETIDKKYNYTDANFGNNTFYREINNKILIYFITQYLLRLHLIN